MDRPAAICDLDAEGSIWAKAPEGAAQRLSTIDLGVGGGWGYEPAHNSEHVTYRLLAPAQSSVGAAANKNP